MMKTSIVVLIVVCLAVLASVGGRDTVEAQTTAPTIGVSTTATIGSVDVNETFTLRFRMRRLAGDAGHGGVTVSIPAFDQRDTRSCRSSYDGPKGSVVTASYTNGASNVCYYARGYQPINKADGSTDVADYLLVESDDTDWPVNGYRTLELDVTPKREGTLTIYYRYWLCGSGYQDCTRFPTIGRLDQQGWNVGIITVPVRNQRPSVARVTPSSKRVRLRPGDTQTFEARATDRNDNISQVEWFVDDRSVSGESLVLTGSINKSFTYRFSNPGTYEVVAEFTDLEGDSDDVDWDVEVTDEINVTVGSNPSGRTISVDGTDRTAPYNTTWDSGTSHTLDVASPQRISGVGNRYVFSRWGHGGSQRQTVRPTSNATYTAYFNLQHFLSTRTEPLGVGIPGGGVWYDHGSTARVGPAPTLEGYRFSHWEKNGQNVGSNAAGVSVRVDAAFLVEAVYTAAVANRPPSVFVVSPLGSPELEPGDSQTFTARATDPDNNITQVEWFVNDRSEGGQSLAPTGLISRSFTYVFSNAGMYRVRATFTDTVGGTDSETWMVKVIPPTLNCFRDLGTLPLGRISISGSWTGDCASTHRRGSYARFYSFILSQRTTVDINLRSSAVTFLYLLNGADSEGSVVNSDDHGGAGNNSLLDVTLEAGTYTVEATTFNAGVTRGFDLYIDATAAPPAPPVLCIQTLPRFSPFPGVSPIEGEWSSDCLSERRTGSYARYYTFTVQATPPSSSTQVTVNLESDVDTYLYLLAGEGSDGIEIASNDNWPHRNTQSQISEFLPGGTYTVEATTNQPAVAGEFFLTVSIINATRPPPDIDSLGCAPLEVLVGAVVSCRPILSGNVPTRFLWSALGGNPSSGTNETFSTRWNTPGIKQIVFEACNDDGCGIGEQAITVNPPPQVVLGDPTNLQAAAAGAGQVRLTWRPGFNANAHWIWSVKPDGTGGTWTQTAGGVGSHIISGLERGQAYWFIVIAGRSVNGVQEWSQFSNWIRASVGAAGTAPTAEGDRIVLHGGSLNGQPIDSANPSLSVAPGQVVSGTVDLSVTNNHGDHAIFPVGATTTWGSHQSSYWGLSIRPPAFGTSRREVSINVTAPDQPGTYAIIFAAQAETTLEHVMSATHWTSGSPRWDNGDDVAGWDASQIDFAIANGYLLAPQYGWDEPTARFGATAVKIIVDDADSRSTPQGARFDAVDTGWSHTCAIRDGGLVACWGENQYGQATPPQGRFVSVSAWAYHTCGVRVDGSVDCWGRDDDGQSTPPRDRFISLSVGWLHACGVKEGGSVSCWGNDFYDQASPPRGRFTSVSAGSEHNCGIKEDRSITCWGSDDYGQATPPEGEFVSVDAGSFHTCGVQANGFVSCWGWNEHGQAALPVGRFASVNAGAGYTCGVRDNGSVACWGENSFGRATPPSGLFNSVSTGLSHTCGVRDDESVVCWGRNNIDQATPPQAGYASVSAGVGYTCGVLADGSASCWGDRGAKSEPAPGRYSWISTGTFHTCGLKVDGSAACWGDDLLGQASPPSGEFSWLNTGWQHTCGLTSDGSVDCWGENRFGQSASPRNRFIWLATGYYHTCGIREDHSVDCWGDDRFGQADPPEGRFDSVTARYYHTCGIRVDGTVACWGLNDDGEASPPPGQFSWVDAGWEHTCGVRTNGTVACWGRDDYGQATPPSGRFASVSAGRLHSCGVMVDGSVTCWGKNDDGEATPP